MLPRSTADGHSVDNLGLLGAVGAAGFSSACMAVTDPTLTPASSVGGSAFMGVVVPATLETVGARVQLLVDSGSSGNYRHGNLFHGIDTLSVYQGMASSHRNFTASGHMLGATALVTHPGT